MGGGYRSDYGQEYCDLFLKPCRPGVVKVGLCFERLLPTIEDLHVYDVLVDYCATPGQVFRGEPQGPELVK